MIAEFSVGDGIAVAGMMHAVALVVCTIVFCVAWLDKRQR